MGASCHIGKIVFCAAPQQHHFHIQVLEKKCFCADWLKNSISVLVYLWIF